MGDETRLVGTDRRARVAGIVLVNSGLLVVLLAVYFGLTNVVLPRLGVHGETFPHALATLVIGMLIVPLRRRVVWLSDRILRRAWQSVDDVLREMTAILSRTVDPQALRALLVDDLPRRIQVQDATLWMLEPPDDLVFRAVGSNVNDPGATLFAHGASIAQLHQCRTFLRIPPNAATAWAAPFQARRLQVVIPLRAGNRLLGVYGVGAPSGRRDQPRHVIDMLLTLAPAAASAMENGRAYAEIARLNEQLRALDQLKDEFIESVGHELRTPLTSLTLALQLLANRPDLAHDMAHVLRENVARLQALVDQVLRMDQHLRDTPGRLPASATVELAPMLADIATEYTPAARAKGLTLQTHVPEAVAVLGDAAYVRRALHEVVDNAVRYSDHGVVCISVEVRDGLALLSIADQGPGIPPEERDQLFDLFFRGRGARALAEKPGAGLGLSLARRDIEALGGRIWLQDTSADGSTMCISLPAELLANNAVGAPSSGQEQSNGRATGRVAPGLRPRG